MRMLKCDRCGHLFEKENAVRYREDYGQIAYGCPECLGDFYEVVVCDECGAVMTEDFIDDVCPECGEVIF